MLDLDDTRTTAFAGAKGGECEVAHLVHPLSELVCAGHQV